MQRNIPTRWSMDSLYDVYTSRLTNSSVETHWHSHFLINLVTKGGGAQIINGIEYPLTEGSIVLLSPMDFHKNIVSDNEVLEIGSIKFSDSVFYDSLTELCDLEQFPVIAKLSGEDFKTAMQLFSILMSEHSNSERLGANLFALSLIRQLVILTLRNAPVKSISTKYDKRLRRALIYIHSHFQKPITVSDVAGYIGYSPNYFSSTFKKQTGFAFQNYLQDLRLNFAMNILKFSDISVTEVCLESGFRTLSHFISTFKNKFGYPPEHFRNMSRRN